MARVAGRLLFVRVAVVLAAFVAGCLDGTLAGGVVVMDDVASASNKSSSHSDPMLMTGAILRLHPSGARAGCVLGIQHVDATDSTTASMLVD